VVIGQEIVDAMISHACEGSPQEVCGLLASDNGRAVRQYRITNAEHSPRFYVMDSQEQLQAILEIDDEGWDVGAVYHSHPATEPRPSPTDIRLAQWPGTLFIIVSLANSDSPEIRAWSIEDGIVTEAPLTVD
jgi:[CysO sulfur-carrier protein]-S-L-cysteine hydrolase